MDVESPRLEFSETYNVSVTIDSNAVLFAMHSGSIGKILTAGAVVYSSSFPLA